MILLPGRREWHALLLIVGISTTVLPFIFLLVSPRENSRTSMGTSLLVLVLALAARDDRVLVRDSLVALQSQVSDVLVISVFFDKAD